MRHETILRPESTALLVIDVQERLLPVMHDSELLIGNCQRLIEGACILNIPILITEQYPKGLGTTVPALKEVAGEFTPYEKLHFSCCGHLPFQETIEDMQREQILVCGIEAHVCVLQTTLDLLASDCQVHVVADAVSSRNKNNCQLALERMRGEGAVISTTESALFELLEQAGTASFKSISKLVR